MKDDKISFKKTGKILDITIPEEMFLNEGTSGIKHLIQLEIFKFIPTLEQVNFVESHIKQQTKPQEKTSKEQKTKTKKAKAP